MPTLTAPSVATVTITTPGQSVCVTCGAGDRMQVDWAGPGGSSGSRLVLNETLDVGPFMDDTVLTFKALAGSPSYNGGNIARFSAGGTSLVGGDGAYVTGPVAAGFARMFSLGDSISADGGRIINSASVPDVNFYQYSWQKYAQLSSGGKWFFEGTFGLAGQTISQIKNTYLPYLLAYAKPRDAVMVLMGQNDLGAINAQTFADYRSVIDSILGAGIVPILCTLTPSITGRTFHALNSFIRALAYEKRLRLIDFTAAVIDNATGTWKAALTRDGVHPTQAGAKAMGLAAGAVLASMDPGLTNSVWLANSNAGYGTNLTTETGGNQNPIFLNDNAGTPPIPTGWSIISGSHAAATSFAAATVGRKLTLATPVGASGEVIARCTCGTAVNGNDILVAFYITANVEAATGYCRFALSNGSGVAMMDYGRGNSQGGAMDISRSLMLMRVKHTGNSGLLFDMVIGSPTTTQATVVLEQFTILNLTAMGYA